MLEAIDARENHIAKVLTDTQQSQRQMQAQKDELSAKNASFMQERESLLTKAKQEAETSKQMMLTTASEEVERQRDSWLASLQHAQDSQAAQFNKSAQDAVFKITRKALHDLSNTELEAHIVSVFIEQIEQADDKLRAEFLSGGNQDLTIRSAHDLDSTSISLLTTKLRPLFPQVRLSFELNPELLCGIEMIGNGHKLSWNIQHYLTSLENSISHLLVKVDNGSQTNNQTPEFEQGKHDAFDK